MYLELPEILKEKNETIEALQEQIAELLAAKDRADADKRIWMKKAMDFDFEAAKARGCYTNCSTFKPHPNR